MNSLKGFDALPVKVAQGTRKTCMGVTAVVRRAEDYP